MLGHVHVEVVRDHLPDPRAEQVRALWAAHGALGGPAAEARLRELVCLAIDERDEVVGVSSAYLDDLRVLGGRRFWVHRHFLDPTCDPALDGVLLAGSFEVLDAHAEVDPVAVGVCVLVDDAATRHRRPEAVWPDVGFVYAGYDERGAQLRVRYFDGARVA